MYFFVNNFLFIVLFESFPDNRKIHVFGRCIIWLFSILNLNIYEAGCLFIDPLTLCRLMNSTRVQQHNNHGIYLVRTG